jgi:hypothetical protein
MSVTRYARNEPRLSYPFPFGLLMQTLDWRLVVARDVKDAGRDNIAETFWTRVAKDCSD